MFLNSFTERGLNEGNPSLDIVSSLNLRNYGGVIKSLNPAGFNDGKSDIFIKNELFIMRNEQIEDLNQNYYTV